MEIISIQEIIKLYPNEWILIGNPTIEKDNFVFSENTTFIERIEIASKIDLNGDIEAHRKATVERLILVIGLFSFIMIILNRLE